MAAPSITRPATAINYGGTITATAPLLRSVLAPASYQLDGCTLPNPSTNNQYGFRVTLPAPVDVSARKWITLVLTFNQGAGNSFSALPNGLSILFIDGSGNWARYPLFYSASNSGNRFRNWHSFLSANEGYFTGFANNIDERQIEYSISLDATPIDTSGTLDWSTLSAYECHIGRTPQSVTSQQISVMRMSAIDTPVIVGGDVSTPMAESRAVGLFTAAGTTAPYNHYRNGRLTSGMYAYNQESNPYAWTHPHEIGDGVTATRYEGSKIGVLWRPSYASELDQYPSIQDSAATRRFRRWNTSSSDYVSLSDFLISGAPRDGGDYDLYVTGNASATVQFTTGTIYAAGVVDLEHGNYTSINFRRCGEVVYHADATYTDCQITGNTWSGSKGLTINAAPGDYSAIDIYFADNTGGHDVTLTPTDNTDPFDLSGLSVKSGQSLKIHNTTATAITVKLATGVTATTSGTGAITIEYPVVLANASITNIVSGSRIRIYNQTTDTEIFNDIITGTSYSADYTDGTDYTAGDIISVRIAWMSGTSAKLPVEYLAVATVNGWAVLANQQDDTVYNTNAIDGSTVTEFIADYPNVQIDVNDPDGTTTPQRCYAWYIAGQMTADGIAAYHGAITAEDEFNYRVNVGVVSLHGQNISTNPLLVVGARIYRSDGVALFVTGNGPVQMEYGRVYALETGTSGLTASESAALLAIPTNPLLTNDARLNNLDATVSSRLPSSSYTAAPTTAQIRTELATELSRLDTAVSTRLAAIDYIEPDNVGIANLPTLSEIEASSIIAKEATVLTRLATGSYTPPDNSDVLAAISNLNDLSITDLQTELSEIPTAILSAAQTTPIHSNTKKINDSTVIGSGVETDKWRGDV